MTSVSSVVGRFGSVTVLALALLTQAGELMETMFQGWLLEKT